MSGELAYAFVAGTVATVNPCGFALLPAYVARQLAREGDEERPLAAVARALAIGAATTGGFLLVFATIGLAVSLGAYSLTRAVPWVALSIGGVLVLVGLFVLRGGHVGVRLPLPARIRNTGAGGSSFLFGIGYGACSLSCTLPIFLTVVAASLDGDALTGGLMFASYATGMGAVLTALAVCGALSRNGLALAVRRLLPYTGRLSGALLVAAGAYVIYYWAFFLTPGAATREAGREPIEALTDLSVSARIWLSQGGGRTAALIVALVALTAVLGWQVVRAAQRLTPGRRSSPTGESGSGRFARDRRAEKPPAP